MIRYGRTNLWRRLTAGLLLVAYIATCAGVMPFPAFAFKKKGGQPFPCQDHACGCATAEDCWQHCCCFTPEERWEWARENNVAPPEYAERPAEEGWSTARLRDQAENERLPHLACTHCQNPPRQNSSCDHSGMTTCCRNESSAQGDRPHDSPPISNGRALLSAWRCQGLSTVWLSTGAVLPFVPTRCWSPRETCFGCIAVSDSRPAVLPFVPPDPPPRTIYTSLEQRTKEQVC
jgi:hypothetical protein